jgi:hypothetical protein
MTMDTPQARPYIPVQSAHRRHIHAIQLRYEAPRYARTYCDIPDHAYTGYWTAVDADVTCPRCRAEVQREQLQRTFLPVRASE